MKHILMVDDNTTNLKMAAQVLSPYYELSMAKSGKQALNFLKKNKPDLILLDLLMPEMDGYQTMEEIKLNPETANIPIIFLTADKQRESEIKSLQLGALDFITKPFEEEVMLSRIEKVLVMDEVRRGLFEEDDKDSDTGLYKFDYVKNIICNHLEADKNGAIILVGICNYAELREKAQSKSFSAYMEYFWDYIKTLDKVGSYGCNISDGDYMIGVTDAMDVDEINGILNDMINYLTREVEVSDGEKLKADIKIGAALCCSDGDFDDFYIKADKAFYHVKNTDFLSWHLYRSDY